MNKARLMSIAIIAVVMSTAFGILSDNGKSWQYLALKGN